MKKQLLTALVFASLFTVGAQAAQPSAAETTAAVRYVWFTKKLNNIQLAGNLYVPPHFKNTRTYPAIVVVHPGGGVKEQTAGIYAQKLAEKGFVTLAFDAAYQGESGGTPRYVEDPASRTEDIRSAIDYLDTLSFVNEDAIGVLGICAGGGYAVHTAQTEGRIKAVATVSAVDSGRTRREGIGGTMTDEGRNTMLAEVGKQRAAEARGADVRYINYVPNSPEAVPQGPGHDMYQEFYEYYRTPRGAHPRSVNQYTFTSLDKMFAYTAFDHVDWISPRPILLIAGSKAGTRYLSEDAYAMAKAPKELYIIPNASHIDLYDKPEYVNPAVDKLTDFYNQYLK